MPPLESFQTRVACVQMAVHPAISVEGAYPMEDPLFEPSGLNDTFRIESPPAELDRRIQELRGRVREAYITHVRAKVRAILEHCRQWNVHLVVFPEYSIPWQLLDELAKEFGDMVVVAGTHIVDRAARQQGVYNRLGWVSSPRLGEAVSPVLNGGKLIGLQPKLEFTLQEKRLHLKEGRSFDPIEIPRAANVPGPMGILICKDFLARDIISHEKLDLGRFNQCRFVVVPSYTPTHSLEEFSAKGWESARRSGKPVLYSDVARVGRGRDGGGTSGTFAAAGASRGRLTTAP